MSIPLDESNRRLTLLADLLEQRVPRDRFDMTTWANGESGGCGFAGCAAGWACSFPEFQALGLTLKTSSTWIVPTHDGLDDWAALRAFFGIEAGDSWELFDDGFYEIDEDDHVSVEQVISRIRSFVSGRQPNA